MADAEPDDAERGVGWLRGPEAGLAAAEGSVGGVLGELLGAEAATAENLGMTARMHQNSLLNEDSSTLLMSSHHNLLSTPFSLREG